MNGELAVLICLATHGTAWLTGPSPAPAPNLAQTHSAFKFVSDVSFPPSRRSWPRKALVLPDIAAWLTDLRRRGVRRLWLEDGRDAGSGDLAPHLATAFSNGASWWLMAEARDSAEAWSARWEFSEESAQSPGSWRIAFRTSTGIHGLPDQPSVEAATAELDEQLRITRDFASRQSLGSWETWFSKALEASTEISYHPDILPANYPQEAALLMSKAARSWVWGGMGSWNDLWFADEVGAEYKRISADLCAANCRAFVAATNVEL